MGEGGLGGTLLQNQNAHNHHHRLQAGHQVQHGGVRLHGLKVTRIGTRTVGKTTNGLEQ